MKGFLFIILIFSIQSCTKWHEVKEGNGILYIDNAESEIHSLSETQWKVGKKKNKTISKGIRFKFDIPKISSEGALKLSKKHRVDSWIFRIVKKSRGKLQNLGNIAYDLANISSATNDITVRIFYHAASISQVYRNFKCPAFSHRYKLNQFEIQDSIKATSDIFASRGKRLAGRYIKPSFAPVIFSSGLTLIGNYTVEYALFNSAEKKLYSKWYKANNSIDVISEGRVSVPSCAGVKEENDSNSNRPPRAEDFRIR
jgi:hypothetical protein